MSANEVSFLSTAIFAFAFLLIFFALIDILVEDVRSMTIFLILLGLGLSLLPILLMKVANMYDPKIAFTSYSFAGAYLIFLLSALIKA